MPAISIKKMNTASPQPNNNNNHNKPQRKKLSALFSDNNLNQSYYDPTRRNSSSSDTTTPSYINNNNSSTSNFTNTNSNPCSASSSPYNNALMSPWTQPSPYFKSPWIHQIQDSDYDDENGSGSKLGLIGSLFREEGHIYSLAASGDLLYTGSDSRNIRVWKDLEDFSGFKSGSGLVKAIVVFGDRIFTGHQDGRIRVWRRKGGAYKRVGSLPTTRDLLVKSVNPRNYVQVRRHKNVPWIKHYDVVSCMSVDVEQGLLYTGSWDKTFKVWRIEDFKCLESVVAHDDAVNSVVVGFDGLVFTGSADGTVKAWRRERVGKYNEHMLVETLLRQDNAVTSLAVSHSPIGAIYAGSSDGLVSYWEREKHFMAYGGVLRGHKMAVLCLAAGGTLVMSGSADKSICVWRRDIGGVHSCVAVLTGHEGPVKCLAVEKEVEEDDEEEGGDDNRWIVYSGSLDKSIKVWRVEDSNEKYLPRLSL